MYSLIKISRYLSSPQFLVGFMSLVFCVVFCRSMFLLVFWPLWCLSCDLWILITLSVSLHSSFYSKLWTLNILIFDMQDFPWFVEHNTVDDGMEKIVSSSNFINDWIFILNTKFEDAKKGPLEAVFRQTGNSMTKAK
jgi:hypothetical protein